MEVKDLNNKYDKMQKKYGDKTLSSIYNGGCEKNPNVCFIFMNPTGKNIASELTWKGRRSPWIGTKNIWRLFYKINLLDENIYNEIQNKKAKDWTEEFADLVYKNVEDNKYFITNLGKCTQIDARPLSDAIYKEYLNLLYKEIEIIKPKKIIVFGNQVSSIFLKQKISVSEWRKKSTEIKIKENVYEVYPVYYPVGNGMRNIDMVIEDLKYILGE